MVSGGAGRARRDEQARVAAVIPHPFWIPRKISQNEFAVLMPRAIPDRGPEAGRGDDPRAVEALIISA
jgi:hypothetical protein